MRQVSDAELDELLADREARRRRWSIAAIIAGVLQAEPPQRMTDRDGGLTARFVQRLDAHLAIAMLPDAERVAVTCRLCWPRVSWGRIARYLGVTPEEARQAWSRGVDLAWERMGGDDLDAAFWRTEIKARQRPCVGLSERLRELVERAA